MYERAIFGVPLIANDGMYVVHGATWLLVKLTWHTLLIYLDSVRIAYAYA